MMAMKKTSAAALFESEDEHLYQEDSLRDADDKINQFESSSMN